MNTCPSCGSANPAGNRFCNNCGGTLDTAPQPVAARVVTIGRDPSNNVQLPLHQTQVGRNHARVVMEGGRLFIEDVGSRNGTFVNGARAYGRTEFSLRDEVRLGSYVMNTAELQPLISGSPQPSTGTMPQPKAVIPAPAVQPQVAVPAPAQAGIQPPVQGQPAVVQVVQNPVVQASDPWSVRVPPGHVRTVGLVILFWILSLGLYGLYWWWVTLDEVKRWRSGQGWSGAMILLAFIPVVNLAILALPFLLPSYVADLYRREGRASPVSPLLGFIVLVPGLLYGVLLGVMIAEPRMLKEIVWLFILMPLVAMACKFVWLSLVQGALNQFWEEKWQVR